MTVRGVPMTDYMENLIKRTMTSKAGQVFIISLSHFCFYVRVTVHFNAYFIFGWIAQYSGHADTKACPLTPSRLFPVPPGRQVW